MTKENLAEIQAKGMAAFMREFFESVAFFAGENLQKPTWDSLQSGLESFLTQDYKNGKKTHLTSSFLDGKSWNTFKQLFDFEGISRKILVRNVIFSFNEDYIGEIFAYSTNFGRKSRVGEFNINDNGQKTLTFSFYNDNLSPIKSMARASILISNQARRKKVKELEEEMFKDIEQEKIIPILGME